MLALIPRRHVLLAALPLAIGLSLPAAAQAPSGEPIKIGYSMAMTGGLAANGKSALLAQKIWEEDVNAKGGLLGRPVKLVYYDDQSNPATVPGIYTKLLDIDKVDLVVGGYATAMLAPAMPIVMQRNKVFIGLLGLAVNAEFNYPNYFVMIPSGPDPKPAFTKGFFDTAMAQSPKPQTVAIVAADQEFSKNAADGARENAKAAGLKIVYDNSYPPATTDFAPIVRAIMAQNPDLVVVCSYPPDSVGMVKAVNEANFRPKMIGGAMVGLQATAFKTQLGPLLNGWVNYDFWLPVEKLKFSGTDELMKKYQARAVAEGVDQLGYYMATWGYAQLQVLGQAIAATKSLDDKKIADHIRSSTFKTVLGDVKFGAKGEWAQSRVLQAQFHDIKGNDVEQFRNLSVQTVLTPVEYKSGNVIYPYEKAREPAGGAMARRPAPSTTGTK
jgi:branched-chain amino acid transport system substrate-binding protein